MLILARNNKHLVSFWKRKHFHLSFAQLSTTKTDKDGNLFQYDEVIKNFKWKVPEYWNFAQDVIDVHACDPSLGKKIAFNYVPAKGNLPPIEWTYNQLSNISKVYSQALHSNLGQINKAIVILPKIPEWWILNISTLRTGTILLPGTSMLTENDIDNRLSKSESDCIIVDLHSAEKVEKIADKHKKTLKFKIFVGRSEDLKDEDRQARLVKSGWISLQSLIDSVGDQNLGNFPVARTRSSDVMQIYFTSGTTGSPKMVGHTHGSYGHCHWVTGKYWLDLTSDDLHWNIADTGWAKSAWSSLFAPWTQGAGVFVHGMSRFVPDDVLKALAKYPVTTLCAPPTMYRSLVMHKKDELSQFKSSRLRHCVSAGEPLNDEVIRIWKDETDIWINEGYGQTETTLIAGTFKGMDIRPGSMGKPAPGYEVKIIDDLGQEVAQGTQGNIAFKAEVDGARHPGLFTGYIGDAAKTEETFLRKFYLTGDRGCVDPDGYIWFDARSDDVIISAGYRIGPFEVESVLLEHASVAESAVVGSPDIERGFVVKAFIVLTPTFQEKIENSKEEEENLIKEIQNFVKSRTAPYKYPRKIEFVSNLPKTVSGKIRRAILRQNEEENK